MIIHVKVEIYKIGEVANFSEELYHHQGSFSKCHNSLGLEQFVIVSGILRSNEFALKSRTSLWRLPKGGL